MPRLSLTYFLPTRIACPSYYPLSPHLPSHPGPSPCSTLETRPLLLCNKSWGSSSLGGRRAFHLNPRSASALRCWRNVDSSLTPQPLIQYVCAGMLSLCRVLLTEVNAWTVHMTVKTEHTHSLTQLIHSLTAELGNFKPLPCLWDLTTFSLPHRAANPRCNWRWRSTRKRYAYAVWGRRARSAGHIV